MNPLALQKREPKREFDQVLSFVKQLHLQLKAMAPVTRETLGDCNYAGVYVFSEGDYPFMLASART